MCPGNLEKKESTSLLFFFYKEIFVCEIPLALVINFMNILARIWQKREGILQIRERARVACYKSKSIKIAACLFHADKRI